MLSLVLLSRGVKLVLLYHAGRRGPLTRPPESPGTRESLRITFGFGTGSDWFAYAFLQLSEADLPNQPTLFATVWPTMAYALFD